MYVITTTNNPEAASCHPTLTKPELVSLAMTHPDDRIRDAAQRNKTKRNEITRYHLFGDPPARKHVMDVMLWNDQYKHETLHSRNEMR
ncbi:hypothetical protein BTUL_0163g00020 [Botrytis tulipae]|uniref:Uncharacterized protein n=1 Tax=Botrytis tulipae TaxID=87230 RepID=A0A4Z1EFH0_9HELO|nr:hypothetical protein BTUL_0163g00020 [Botrytis tulipae]